MSALPTIQSLGAPATPAQQKSSAENEFPAEPFVIGPINALRQSIDRRLRARQPAVELAV
jgi:hypothetical protein